MAMSIKTMFGYGGKSADDRAKVEAIMRSQAVIEFKLDGTILTANENFLGALGYTLDEIAGKHHRMFVDPIDAQSAEYRQFWADLAAGKYQAAAYRRIARAAAKSGSRPPTTRSSTKPASRSR
jgi:methyl-accepting chemotaxis protein